MTANWSFYPNFGLNCFSYTDLGPNSLFDLTELSLQDGAAQDDVKLSAHFTDTDVKTFPRQPNRTTTTRHAHTSKTSTISLHSAL